MKRVRKKSNGRREADNLLSIIFTKFDSKGNKLASVSNILLMYCCIFALLKNILLINIYIGIIPYVKNRQRVMTDSHQVYQPLRLCVSAHHLFIQYKYMAFGKNEILISLVRDCVFEANFYSCREGFRPFHLLLFICVV